MFDRMPMFDPDKPLKQIPIDAVKLFFKPLREPKQRRVVLVVALVGGLIGAIDFLMHAPPV
jgi:hypothetical protein